jgi:hypothetical protein
VVLHTSLAMGKRKRWDGGQLKQVRHSEE